MFLDRLLNTRLINPNIKLFRQQIDQVSIIDPQPECLQRDLNIQTRAALRWIIRDESQWWEED